MYDKKKHKPETKNPTSAHQLIEAINNRKPTTLGLWRSCGPRMAPLSRSCLALPIGRTLGIFDSKKKWSRGEECVPTCATGKRASSDVRNDRGLVIRCDDGGLGLRRDTRPFNLMRDLLASAPLGITVLIVRKSMAFRLSVKSVRPGWIIHEMIIANHFTCYDHDLII